MNLYCANQPSLLHICLETINSDILDNHNKISFLISNVHNKYLPPNPFITVCLFLLHSTLLHCYYNVFCIEVVLIHVYLFLIHVYIIIAHLVSHLAPARHQWLGATSFTVHTKFTIIYDDTNAYIHRGFWFGNNFFFIHSHQLCTVSCCVKWKRSNFCHTVYG